MPGPRPAARAEPDPPIESVFVGRTWTRGKLRSVEIGVDGDGVIRAVGRSVPGGERWEFGDLVILPSATDLHVHTREPGHDRSESLPGATLQAALGGVGLIGEMPNTNPAIDDPDRLEEQLRRVGGRAVVDVLVYALAHRADRVRALGRSAGAFKLYLSPSTGVEPPTPEEAARVLQAVSETGLALTVHAEDPAKFGSGASPGSLAAWDSARPPAAETAAIAALLTRTPPLLRLHVGHVTTPESVDLLRTAGHSFEVTPQHLLLARSDRSDSYRKVNPPLRSPSNRAGLFERFARGDVPILASDHAPHLAEAKDRPFPLAPSGMPGVETMLPLLLEQVRAGNVPLPVLLAAASDRPARWAGQPRGRIAPGHRADLLVVDFRARRTLRGRDLHGECGWTAFEGRTAIFPRHHFRRGRQIVQDGEFVGAALGQPVRPQFALP